jgi:hypothetical protein
MSDTSKPRRPAAAPQRGEAAWRAAKDAVASRNERASKAAQARRQAEYEEQAAERRAAERRDQAALAKRTP